MKRYAEFIIKYRVAIIVVTLGVTAYLGYAISTLNINSDILSYLPQDKENVRVFNDVGKTFGGNSMAVVAFEAPDEDIFTTNTLTTLRKMTQAYKELDGVRSVISLTNILDIKQIEDGFEVGKLVPQDRIPETSEELEALRDYTMSKDMYSGRLVSTDGKYTAVMIRLNEGVDRAQVGEVIRDATEEMKGDLQPYYAGLPLWMVFINEIIFGDMGLLIPLVALLVMFTLFVSFRTKRGVLLPLGTVLLSTTWAVGLMAVFEVDLTLISNGLPVLLIAIGSAYGIHMLNKYNEVMSSGIEPAEGIKQAIAEVGLPIILAGLTTLAGFLSFSTSYLTLIREFGVFTAVGVLCALLLSTSFLPAVLSFMKPRGVRYDRFGGKRTVGMRAMATLADAVTSRPKWVLAGAAVLAILAAMGLARIERSVNMVEYFEKESQIRVAEEMMEEKFGGAMVIQIRVQGPIKDPFVLKEMLRVEKFLNTLPYVSNAQSVADLVCEMNQQMNGRYSVPDSAAKVGNLWTFLEGNEVMDQLITPDEKEAVIQATVGTADSGKLMTLVNSVNEFVRSQAHLEWTVVALVDSDAVEDSSAEKARRQLVDRVAQMVGFDVSARSKQQPLSVQGVQDVVRMNADLEVSLGNQDHFAGTIDVLMSYLAGDESEIEIESEEVLEGLKKRLGGLVSGRNESEATIRSVLIEELEPELYEDEPEAVDDLSSALLRLLEERRQGLKVDAIMAQLKAVLPAELASNEWLLRDLNGDLWELNNQFAAVYGSDSSGGSSTSVSLAVTGMPPIYKELDESLVSSQYRSLLIAVLIVFLLIGLQFRSLWAGLIGIIPISFTVMFNFGLMSYLHIPLDITTVMIGSVAVGIGVDYTIHFMSRLRREYSTGISMQKAIVQTMETTGIAIMINAVSVSMGFLALLFGSLVPMRNFGWMTALTMIVSAFSAMILLPAILVSLRKVKFLNNVMR